MNNESSIVKMARALSDPHRLRIFRWVIQRGSLTVGQAQQLTFLAQPSVSFHIKQLIESELLRAVKKGRTIYLFVNQGKVDEFIAFFGQIGQEP
jgi:ArsR family transcriptional regulator, arsenate/arsenite/antimonite-responsive transcriptional repressor